MLGSIVYRRLRGFKPSAVGVLIISWWLAIAGTVALTLPTTGASATPTPAAITVGRIARIYQPGLPEWPIPTDRRAFDEAQRGFRESDEALLDHAFDTYEWIRVSHRQAVRVVTVDGEAVEVELLEGPHASRRAWLKPRNLMP